MRLLENKTKTLAQYGALLMLSSGMVAHLPAQGVPQASYPSLPACPVVITGLDPRAASLTPGTALAVTFENRSSETITGLAFQARAGRGRIVPLLVRHSIAPGASDTEQWNDSAWLPRFSADPEIVVWPQVINFDHANSWTNPTGSNAVRCSFSTLDAEVAQSSAGSGTAAVPVRAGTNSQMSAADKQSLIESGAASLLIVHTYPEGAGVAIDGKAIGIAPLTLVLKKLDHPRTILISKVGYDLVQRSVTPDGTKIVLNVTLNSLLDLKGANGNVRPE